MPSVQRKCGIYKIVCRGNGKAYYGSTNDWRGRKATHQCELRRGRHHCSRLQHCWNKYGEESFDFVWIENVAEALLTVVEQKYLDAVGDKLNSAKDAERPTLGLKHSEEWRRNHSNILTGRKWSAERRARFVPRKGFTQSAEARRKCSEAHKASGRMKGEKNYFHGNPRPPEELRERARRKQLRAKAYYPTPYGRWRVMWSCPDGKRRTWMFKTEQEAIDKVAELKQTIA
jgi:group I intron endonuclease